MIHIIRSENFPDLGCCGSKGEVSDDPMVVTCPRCLWMLIRATAKSLEKLTCQMEACAVAARDMAAAVKSDDDDF